MINYKKLEKIKKSSIGLAGLTEKKRNEFLRNLSLALRENRQKIVAANRKDVNRAQGKKLPTPFISRLTFDGKKLENILRGLKELQKLKSGIGEMMEEKKLNNGILLSKIRVSIGVIFIIYEARPEVTIDSAALCIKSGNAVILKGGSEALETNKILYQCIRQSLVVSDIIGDAVCYLSRADRQDIYNLLQQKDYIDLVVARGGYDMVKAITDRSKISVLSHSAGGARIYVDASADLNIAGSVITNAKVSSPATCNSLDTIIVHRKIAKRFIPQIVEELKRYNVKIHMDDGVNDDIWKTEFLDLDVAIKIVQKGDEAIKFIQKYSKKHTEGIIAQDKNIINKFINKVDAASIMVNCSTRLHDGGVFGMGGEIGIATGKLHARGPVGLKELTTYKWIVQGKGQIRH